MPAGAWPDAFGTGYGHAASRKGAWVRRHVPLCRAGRASLLLVGTVRHLGALLVGMLLPGVMGMVWNVNQVTLVQHRSPEPMAGRIASAFRTASTSGVPLGALLG